MLRQNLAIARGFTPMQQQEMQALRDRCAQYAAEGRFELFKSSKKFDADEGRRQHGFPPQAEAPTSRDRGQQKVKTLNSCITRLKLGWLATVSCLILQR
jgi:hypothetical protein